MHIKYVLIKKFKSYRELSYMEALDKGVNVIIGANGHGKSNFLDAIIFVLTEKYSNLRQEDKKLLVHEEPSEEIQQISVELIIDNKSRRFPLDKDTINIVKIYHIQDNREEILINQKKLTKSEVYNMLESAGFCKQHPYYIIQQGKINTIINMNEFELFEQFAEVTGTKIYEEKKFESLALLSDAKDNRNKIIKQREEISNYMSRLESQCEELNSFEKFESKKKACEFFIFNEKVADYQINIDLLEERKNAQATSLQSLSINLSLLKEKINDKLSSQISNTKLIDNFRAKINRCESEILNINQHTFIEEASLRALNNLNINQKITREQIELDLAILSKEKTKLNEEYLKIQKKFRDVETEIETIQIKFEEINGKRDMILIKGGTGSESTNNPRNMSEKDRKNLITSEISKLTSLKEEINSKVIELNSLTKIDEDRLNNIEKEIIQINSDMNDNLLHSIKQVNDSVIEYKKKRVELFNSIKKTDMSINEMNEETEIVKTNIKQIEKYAPNYELLKAILAIKNENINGCYGILMDLINVDKKYKNAMDIFAKDKLYAIIVDNMETANKILEFNKKQNGPVITIYPLDWNTEVKQFTYPNTDALPFVKFIQVRDNIPTLAGINSLQPIINKVFGKCLLVKNYEIGVKFAKQYYMNCVTAENEIIYSGGFVTKVGYYDYKRQRCVIYDQLIYNFEKLQISQEKIKQLQDQRAILSDSETRLLRDTQTFLLKKNELSNKLDLSSKKNQLLSEEQNNIKQIIISKKASITQFIQDKFTIDQKILNYNTLLMNKNFTSPTELEIQEVNTMYNQREVYEKKLIELEKAKHIIIQQKVTLETNLNEVILGKEFELKSQLAAFNKEIIHPNNNGITTEENILNIENNFKEIQNLDKAKKSYQIETERLEKETELISNEISNFKNESNKLNDKINKNEAELKAVLLSLTDTSEKKNQLLKNIANLGQIKSEEIEKFAKIKEMQLKLIQNESGIDVRDNDRKISKFLEPIYKKLEEINRKMKKFEKINRFALDDYKLFKSKLQEVHQKLEDLQTNEKEILDVIRVLDEKKENAIQSTFEKVNQSFEYFFKELVPMGYSKLTLDTWYNTGLTTQTQKTNPSKAIFINVSFTGDQNNIQSMHQLSGGQRTAVAVALIFALSKIDPPPFYILDEIDSALDPSMRSNLARLITNLSKNNQYIISTFKPEALDVSTNIYQVKFANKSSNMMKISLEEAKNFIQEINI